MCIVDKNELDNPWHEQSTTSQRDNAAFVQNWNKDSRRVQV